MAKLYTQSYCWRINKILCKMLGCSWLVYDFPDHKSKEKAIIAIFPDGFKHPLRYFDPAKVKDDKPYLVLGRQILTLKSKSETVDQKMIIKKIMQTLKRGYNVSCWKPDKYHEIVVSNDTCFEEHLLELSITKGV